MSPVSRRTLLAAAATGAAAFPTRSTAAQAQTRSWVEHYSTPPGAELIASITRVRQAPYRYTTLYSLKLPALRTGDVIMAHAQFEVTNDLGFNVMIAHAMLLHRSETRVAHGDMPEGRALSEYAGENLTPDMHHGFRTLAGSFAAEVDGDAWLSVIIYSASDATKPGDVITVERGYGGLRAIVFRNS